MLNNKMKKWCKSLAIVGLFGLVSSTGILVTTQCKLWGKKDIPQFTIKTDHAEKLRLTNEKIPANIIIDFFIVSNDATKWSTYKCDWKGEWETSAGLSTKITFTSTPGSNDKVSAKILTKDMLLDSGDTKSYPFKISCTISKDGKSLSNFIDNEVVLDRTPTSSYRIDGSDWPHQLGTEIQGKPLTKNYNYTIFDDIVTYKNMGNFGAPDLTIPSVVADDSGNRYTCINIADGAFQNNQKLAGELTLSDSVFSVGSRAFWMSKISSLVIGKNVKLVDDYSFAEINTLTTLKILTPYNTSYADNCSFVAHCFWRSGTKNDHLANWAYVISSLWTTSKLQLNRDSNWYWNTGSFPT